MPKNKTTYTNQNVTEFLETIENEQKQKDSLALISIFENITGHNAKMWGPSIIGFGNYFYKYQSGHEGTAPLLGFSPRKSAFSLYIYTPDGYTSDQDLQSLGKFKMGKACIYVNKLADIKLDVLRKIALQSIKFIEDNHEIIK